MIKNYSKYDFVKVRVYLNDKDYYVLSRYLISRVLTSTLVEQQDAVSIALDLKKYLVDCGKLELHQEELESILFQIMTTKSSRYGAYNISLYRLMSNFHHRRIPLIILLAGTFCVGKSSVATSLAEKLNLSSVLPTDMIYTCNIIPGLSDKPFDELALESCNKSELVEEFQKTCDIVQNCLQFHLNKCINDGKSIIIEGVHVGKSLLEMARSASSTGIIVPFLLIADKGKHSTLLDQSKYHEKLSGHFTDIQEYLVEELSSDFKVEQLSSDVVNSMHISVMESIKMKIFNYQQ